MGQSSKRKCAHSTVLTRRTFCQQSQRLWTLETNRAERGGRLQHDRRGSGLWLERAEDDLQGVIEDQFIKRGGELGIAEQEEAQRFQRQLAEGQASHAFELQTDRAGSAGRNLQSRRKGRRLQPGAR